MPSPQSINACVVKSVALIYTFFLNHQLPSAEKCIFSHITYCIYYYRCSNLKKRCLQRVKNYIVFVKVRMWVLSTRQIRGFGCFHQTTETAEIFTQSPQSSSPRPLPPSSHQRHVAGILCEGLGTMRSDAFHTQNWRMSVS